MRIEGNCQRSQSNEVLETTNAKRCVSTEASQSLEARAATFGIPTPL